MVVDKDSRKAIGVILGIVAFILAENLALRPWDWIGTLAWALPYSFAGVEVVFSGFPRLVAESQYTYPLASFLGWALYYVVEYGILGLLLFLSFRRRSLGLRVFALCEIGFGVLASLLYGGMVWNPVLAPICALVTGGLAVYLPFKHKEASHV